MATHTVVALFDDYREAESAVRDLEAAGVPSTDISLIANNASNRYGDYPQYEAVRTDRADTTDTDTKDTGAATGTGAGIGAVLGGAAGLLAGIGALAIPGVGPVVAAGALASTLAGAGVGAVVGGLVGALVEAGIPREHADIYAEAVRRGGTLVTVRVDDAMRDRVSDILSRHAPVDIEERAQSWRQAGWRNFDERAEPYTGPTHAGGTGGRVATTAPTDPARAEGTLGTSELGTRPDRPVSSLPEAGTSSGTSTSADPNLQRDWDVRRDEDRTREDAGRRTAVRIYPRVEEPAGRR
jgi:hypothetical protein